MNSYKYLATFYDRLMDGYEYSRMIDYICGSVTGQKGIDLACGSGKITIELAKKGFNLTGIDNSQEMLNQACVKAKQNSVNIPFICENLEDADFTNNNDFMLATCDVINYLSIDNVKLLFKNIYNSLNVNGNFIFDFSSFYKLSEILGNNIFYEDYDDLTMIWQNELNDNQIDMDITFFVMGNNLYERFDEYHKQYLHKLKDIIEIAKQVGFDVVEMLDGNTFDKLEEKTTRILINLQKS